MKWLLNIKGKLCLLIYKVQDNMCLKFTKGQVVRPLSIIYCITLAKFGIKTISGGDNV